MTKRDPPSGNVTFLFTDIESSTWLLQHLGDDYDEVLHTHNDLLRAAWDAHDGYEVSTEGDAFFVTFDSPDAALAAALTAQRALASHSWPDGVQLRVRMGVHTGEARVYDGQYVGLGVHQAARIASAAHGGQVLVSETARVDRFSFVDLGPHRLKDLAQPLRIYQLAADDLPSEFPPPRTLSVLPNNFPIQVTSFIGRDDDIEGVRAALDDSRLVTLTGAGGVGKTRLALQVGAELLDVFEHGAWMVDLAPLSDPAVVAGAVADALGVHEQPGRPIVESVTDHLLTRKTLIVIDNCEHLIDECAKLVHQLLSRCAGVKVLATSREALNVPGESTWRLRSLTVPDGTEALEIGSLARTESVRLFVQRARAASSDFDITPANADAVAQICRRLDGLPLALELAAARVRTMTPQDIATRLDDRFRLLTGGARMALPRQRTLEAAVGWSYDLLSPSEQLLFDRLSVFAGGCSLAAAEHVCTSDELSEQDVVDMIQLLVERSLVVPDEGVDGRTRYRLLETLRQFGRDRLVARGEAVEVRNRHLAWAVEMAQTLPPGRADGAVQPPETQAEEDNLRAAIEWAIESGDLASGLHIVAAVVFGHLSELRRWHDTLLVAGDEVPPTVHARGLAASLGILFMLGDWTAGVERSTAAVEVSKRAADHEKLAEALVYQGVGRWALGEEDSARRLMEEGLAVARAKASSQIYLALGLMMLAWYHSERDLDQAEQLASELAWDESIAENHFARAHGREVIGFVHCLQGDLVRGGRELAEAVELFKDVQLECGAHMLEAAAAWTSMVGLFEAGAETWGAAQTIREETGDRPRPWERPIKERWLPLIREGMDPEAFEAAFSRGRKMGFEEAADAFQRTVAGYS